MKKPLTNLTENRIDLTSIKSKAFYEEQHFVKCSSSQNIRIVDTEFSDCIFKDCKFFEVSFFDCIFQNCIFENCDMASVSVKHTSFQDVQFVDCKLTGIQWADASTPLDANFKRCLMSYSGFCGVNLRNTELLNCQLKEVDFTEANLTKANCNYSDFTGARFINSNLTHTDFTNATNYAIHPDGNILCKTKFSLPEALSLLEVYDIIVN